MTQTRKRKLLFAALPMIALLSAFSTYLGQSTSKEQKPGAQSSQVIPLEKDREEGIKRKLAALLGEVGVRMSSSGLIAETQTYRELHIRWEAPEKPGAAGVLEGQQLSRGTLARVSSNRRAGTLPRERSLELSSERLLVIAVDENNDLRWWRLMIDPRLVRAETPSPSGEMRSDNLYRTNVDFSIECPDDPQLKQLRLYLPVWNGEEFHLELLGTLPIG